MLGFPKSEVVHVRCWGFPRLSSHMWQGLSVLGFPKSEGTL